MRAALWLLAVLAVPGCSPRAEPVPTSAGVEITPPRAVPSAPPKAVEPATPSIARLRSLVEGLCGDFRFAGSRGERAAAEYIKEQFAALGYEPTLESFPIPGGLRSQNVVCIKRADRRPLLVIGAHYDAKPPVSPGAIDNASGIAALLEAARLLRDVDLDVKLAFVAFGAEERAVKGAGHHFGSRHYVRTLLKRVDATDIVGMINIDMACGETLYLGSMGLADPTVLAVVRSEAARMGITYETRKERADSDHEAFEKRGVPVAYVHYWPAKDGAYHNAKDRPELVDYDQVKGVARLVADAVVRLSRSL